MLVAADFREKAREALRGNWALAVGTGFIATLLGAYTALGSSGNNSGISDSLSEYLDSGLLSEEIEAVLAMIALILLLIIIVSGLIHFVIGGPISLGYARFNLDLVDENGPMFSDLFSGFNRFGQAFLLHFLRYLYVSLWALLFLIPGLIKCYSYAMAPYIMCDNPGMSASDAITESKRLMDGNKWRLFCLNFSFVGWDILCGLFTLGIGSLWLQPYREAAFAAFYREIKDAKYSTPVKVRPNVSYQSMPSWDGFENF